jgi:hypothetical protein
VERTRLVELDPEVLDWVLRRFIAELDYDLLKNLEHNEFDGSDSFPALVKQFITLYTSRVGS